MEALGLIHRVSDDFNGLPIVFREDGYINMTSATKHYKRKAIDFLRLPGTNDYLEALAELLKVEKSHLWITKKGRYGGTLLHPKMAVPFARWLDVRFAVWCDLMIDNILHGNIQTTVAVPTEEALKVQAVAGFRIRFRKCENFSGRVANRLLPLGL